MMFGSIARSASMLAVLGTLPTAFAASVSKEQLEMEREGVQLIRQLEEVGRDVRYHAGRLNSFTSFTTTLQISRWAHAHHLEQIRSLVNDGLRPAMSRLTQIQPHLPDWKQQSIDKMFEAARELAAETSSAILTKNETGTVPPSMNVEYKRLVARVYEHAEALVRTSDAAGTYATARMKAAEAGLTVPMK